MGIPNRFASPSLDSRGIIEAEIIKDSEKSIEVKKVIDFIDLYAKYFTDESTVKKIVKVDSNVLSNFANDFSLDLNTYPDQIQSYINLYLKENTGNVVYKDKDGNEIEIRISDGVYINNNQLKDVLGNLLYNLNQKVEYNTENDNLLDLNGNVILSSVTEINSKLSNLQTEIDSININYDSDNKKIIDKSSNTILDIDNLNTTLNNLQSEIDSININYDSKDNLIVDKDNNTILDVNEINPLKRTSVFNIQNSGTNETLTSTSIKDYFDAFSFTQDSSDASKVILSIDTDKLKISNINLLLTVYYTDTTNTPLIPIYNNIQKDSDGNITSVTIEVLKTDGTNQSDYNLSITVSF
jgi:uncharacterized small protein (DUF1192 family)